ncbi:type II and III secretion system protein family protein [Brevundimonas sp.]|uniref:type II and III secretion system protein family protein n=1 Tax=Brevundimonas sp. TaxID=1871086 RepID=UPI002B5DFA7E|nr:type II and III secretion system protein family protein [Brevundimonas sp.]HWQ87235.1 type II and III secretion system protein family protein [Brevundimonas sp.]
MKRLIALALAGLTVVATGPALPGVVQAQSRAALPMGSGAQIINLPRGSSMAIDLPSDARDVIVPNPVVAEAMLHSPRRITIIGLQPGETDAVVLDAAGRTILSLRIRVDTGVSALQDTLSRVMPGSSVRAEAVNDSIILSGPVANPGEADRAAQVARAFVTTPEKVINMMTIAGSDQVMIKARVIEVQRSAIKQLGLSTNAVVNSGTNFVSGGRANSYGVNGAQVGGGSVCIGQNGARTTNYTDTNRTTTESGAIIRGVDTTNDIRRVQVINGQVFIDGLITTETRPSGTSNIIENLISTAYQTITGTNTQACLQAFERIGLIRTLAEPNLTSVNGENAEFLAGGEFPVPVGRTVDATTGQTTIGIEFKPFGVRLAFRPIVLSEGRISLQLSTEVSELTTVGAFTLGGGDTGDALVIPALNVRRASSTVELPSGGSMMIAGLLREETRQNIDDLPGIGNLPVLGALFRSRDYLSGETELVIIVEAFIVSPTSPGRLQTPSDGLIIANDAQTLLFGQLNQRYRRGDASAVTADAGWAGPVGYVIE